MASTSRAPYEEHPDQLELPLREEIPEIDPELAIFCNPQMHQNIRAKPMQLDAYLDLRGWRKDYPDLNLQAEGYVVERPDLGPPNHPSFPFFIAWLPKSQFEKWFKRVDP